MRRSDAKTLEAEANSPNNDGFSFEDHIVVLEPDSKEMKAQSLLKRRVIKQKHFVIGRRSVHYGRIVETRADLKIANQYPYTVSKEHCEIELLGGRVILRDLGSRNGTYVNGKRLGRGKGKPREVELGAGSYSLVLGDRIGNVRFLLTIE